MWNSKKLGYIDLFLVLGYLYISFMVFLVVTGKNVF